MKKNTAAAPLRDFRFSKLQTPAYRHLKLLAFWPVYGMLFLFIERFCPGKQYHPVQCALDRYIPFCEWFFLPYCAWFFFVGGVLFYAAGHDAPAFTALMRYIIVTHLSALTIYFFYPTCQNLRPAAFPRANALTRCVAALYAIDTSTNVCPSIHVLGAVGAWLASLRMARFRSAAWRVFFFAAMVLISISTVFIKQHSAMDVLMALPLCLLGWLLCFHSRSGNAPSG